MIKDIIEKIWKKKPNYLKIIANVNCIAIVEDIMKIAIEDTRQIYVNHIIKLKQELEDVKERLYEKVEGLQ